MLIKESMKKRINIALDGPAASGKSTTARLLAEKLNYIYIDTGAMYRAVTLAVLQDDVDINDENSVVSCVNSHTVSIKIDNMGQRTFLDDMDVTDKIRIPEINRTISAVSSYAGVRSALVAQQRRLAKNKGVVMDGRDIGTVVLPAAELKVFMIAGLKERARRRYKELQTNGIKQELQDVIREIAERDRFDSSRSQAPLKKADKARELDTSNLSIEEQVKIIKEWVDSLIVD